jgi:MYXO-CTERM domain-containing protein
VVDESDLLPQQGYIQALSATGAALRRVSRWLNAASVNATEAQIDQMRALPYVARIEPVRRYRRAAGGQATTGVAPQEAQQAPSEVEYGYTQAQLDLLGAPTAHDCGLTGEGVVIGVLDSGFQVDLPVFSSLEVLATYDFVHDDANVADEWNDPGGQHDHGTSVLSLIAGYMPGTYVGGAFDVSVILAKTEDVENEVIAEEDNYVAGLEFAEAHGADIVTSSLGYLDWWAFSDFDGKTSVTSLAVDAAVSRGVVALTAMGNEGPGPQTLAVPADAFNVLSIGSIDLGANISSFSSRGPTADGRMKPEFVAPGGQVWVARASGGYEAGDGTSYATPLAAAMVALLLQQDPALTPAQVLEVLRGSVSSYGEPDSVYGYGLIDIAAATYDSCNCPDADLDGYKAEECGGQDCDDTNAAIHPLAIESCTGLVDDNCDGLVDIEDTVCTGTVATGGTGGNGPTGIGGATSVPGTGGTSPGVSSGGMPAATAASELGAEISDAEPNEGEGCSCHAAGTSSGPEKSRVLALLSLFALALLVRRRSAF